MPPPQPRPLGSRTTGRSQQSALMVTVHRTRRSPPPARLPVVSVIGVVVALCAAVLAGPAWAQEDPVGVWPLSPEPPVVHGFDPPSTPYGAGHRGVDLGGVVGQPVLAALPGRVSFAGRLAGRGVVVVDHGATRTTYEPVAAVVGVGARVSAGQRLGHLEAVGSHCLPRACLHWGWIDGEHSYLDPLRLVGPEPVRLLPLWRDAPVTSAPAALRSPFDAVVGGLLGGAQVAQARGWAWR